MPASTKYALRNRVRDLQRRTALDLSPLQLCIDTSTLAYKTFLPSIAVSLTRYFYVPTCVKGLPRPVPKYVSGWCRKGYEPHSQSFLMITLSW